MYCRGLVAVRVFGAWKLAKPEKPSGMTVLVQVYKLRAQNTDLRFTSPSGILVI